MNILLLTSVYPSPDDENENVTKVVRYFAKEWGNQGHTVRVIHNVHRYPLLVHLLPKFIKRRIAAKLGFYIPDMKAVKAMRFEDGDVSVNRIPVFKFLPHGDHPRRAIVNVAKKIESLNSSVGFSPDLIVGHWMSPQVQIIARLKEVYHCRTALVLHGRGYLNDPKFDAKKYLKSIDALGCRSRAEAEYVQSVLGCEKKPFVCYSGVPDDFITGHTYDEEKFASVPKKWRFIYVGRLVAYKSIDKVLHALAAFRDRDFVFDVIGNGAEEASLKNLAHELGIEEKVVFHGRMPRDRVMDYMRKAHCFVMISKGEIFGLVYLEAMAASCLAIGSKDEGIDGVIENGVNGFLAPAADADGLKAVLDRLFEMDAQQLQKYSRMGFNTASEFTDSNVAKWYLESIFDQ